MPGDEQFVTTRDLSSSLWQSVVEDVFLKKQDPLHPRAAMTASGATTAVSKTESMIRAMNAIVKEREDDKKAQTSGEPSRARAAFLDDAARCAKAAMDWAFA